MTSKILQSSSPVPCTFVLCIFLFCQAAFCQTDDSIPRTKIYHVNRITGGIIIAAGLATDYPAIGRIKGKANLTTAEVAALNPGIINPLDRWALHQSTGNYLFYSKLSDDIEPPIFVILPAILGFDKKIKKDWLDLFFMYCEGHVITFTFYNYSWLGPTFQDRYRPVTYYTDLSLSTRMSGNNRNSAYSGHTASVAYTSFFMAKVYSDYNPDANKFLLYTAALVPPLVMGYLRVMALAHFPSDDITGLTVGSVIGIVLPELHKMKCKNITLGMLNIPGATGLDVCWTLPSYKFSESIK
jgi:hypothetical protein